MPQLSDDPVAGLDDVSERDRDLMARTLYGEAGATNPRAQAAVAQAIVNRTLADGFPGTVGEVVLQRGQFEPWATRRGELMGLPRDSRAYREARQTVDDVLAGRVPDMTGGATHFFAPKAQAALGRSVPAWARERLASEGGHDFFAPMGRVERDAAVPPIDLSGATWTSMEGAGIAPRGTGKPQPGQKAVTMPDTSSADDDLLRAYGVEVPKPATTAKATGKAAPVIVAPAPAPAGKGGGLSDDALLGMYLEGAPARQAGKPASPPAGKPESLPLASPDGIVDGNTGALVVAGKPFTDNSKTAGVYDTLTSLANGAVLGAAVPIAAGAAALREKFFGSGGSFADNYRQAASVYGGMQDSYRAANPGTAAATEIAGSIPTTVGATMLGGAALGAGGNLLLDTLQGSRLAAPLARTGQFVTGGAGQGAGAAALAARMGSRGVAGAAGGAFGGAINTGLTGGGIGDNALMGATLGTVVGGGLPAAGAAARGVANRLTGSASPEAAQLAATARDNYGIPIRAGQITDSPAVRFLDSTLSRTPGMGYGAANRAQQTAVNRAVAQIFGETADRVTPAVMEAARARLGQTFDRVAQGSWVRLDNEFAQQLGDTFREAGSVLTPQEMTPLRNLIRDGILPKFGTLGEIEGNQYQALTRKGSPLDRLMSSANPNVRFYASQFRDALDGALERSAPQELVAELRQARRQWRAMKTVEDLAASSPTGDISPAGLMQAVKRSYGSRVAYQGGGELGDLSRIGQRFLKEPPSSGTAERLGAKDTLSRFAQIGQMAGGAAGAAVGLNHFAPGFAAQALQAAPGAILPAAGAFGATRLLSAGLRSQALSNRLIDQALGTSRAGPVNRLVALGSAAAPAPAAAVYNRGQPVPAVNDNGPTSMAEYWTNRPQRVGSSVH